MTFVKDPFNASLIHDYDVNGVRVGVYERAPDHGRLKRYYYGSQQVTYCSASKWRRLEEMSRKVVRFDRIVHGDYLPDLSRAY